MAEEFPYICSDCGSGYNGTVCMGCDDALQRALRDQIDKNRDLYGTAFYTVDGGRITKVIDNEKLVIDSREPDIVES